MLRRMVADRVEERQSEVARGDDEAMDDKVVEVRKKRKDYTWEGVNKILVTCLRLQVVKRMKLKTRETIGEDGRCFDYDCDC